MLDMARHIGNVRISFMFPWSTERRDCRALFYNTEEALPNHNGNGKEIRIAKKGLK